MSHIKSNYHPFNLAKNAVNKINMPRIDTTPYYRVSNNTIDIYNFGFVDEHGYYIIEKATVLPVIGAYNMPHEIRVFEHALADPQKKAVIESAIHTAIIKHNLLPNANCLSVIIMPNGAVYLSERDNHDDQAFAFAVFIACCIYILIKITSHTI